MKEKVNTAEVKKEKEIVFLEDTNVMIKGEIVKYKKGKKYKFETEIADKLIKQKVATDLNKEKQEENQDARN